MVTPRRIRRSRRSTFRGRRSRAVTVGHNYNPYPNYDRAFIVKPAVNKPRNYKPIIVPRPTMLQFAPYEEGRSSRKFFILMVYLITVVILMLAFIQWELVSLCKPLRDLSRTELWINTICALLAMIILSIFMLIREARYLPIFNWVLLIFIIELTIIGICALAAFWEPVTLVIYFLISVFLIIVCLLIGTFIPCDLTANVAAIFLISIILFIIAQLMIVLHVINTVWDGFFFAFSILNMSIVFVFVMYHAQLIRGGRYAEIRATDGLFAVVVLFFYFCLIFMLFAYGVWPHLDRDKKDEVKRDSIEHINKLNDDYDGGKFNGGHRRGGMS